MIFFVLLFTCVSTFIVLKKNEKNNYLFTSESVSEGHPDKVCDRISDMVVDSYLSKDPFARVACETLTTTNKVVLAGEIRAPEIKKEELIQKVRDCIKDIGYDQDGFSWKEKTSIESHLHSQSSDIAMGVDSKIIKMKELEIKELCLAMHVMKQKNKCQHQFIILIKY